MGFRRNRGRAALVIVEMALALVLLAGAGLLIRTFVAMRTADRGFDEQNVLTFELPLRNSQFQLTSQVTQLVRATERRHSQDDRVSEVAVTCALPLEPSFTMPLHDSRPRSDSGGPISWRVHLACGLAWILLGVSNRLLRGRVFTNYDDEGNPGVVVINQATYKRFWQDVDANPIGDFITIGKGMGAGMDDLPRRVIGVVADVRDAGLRMEPMIFVPVAQVPDGMNTPQNRLLPLTWVVRVDDPASLPTGATQRELHEASGGLPPLLASAICTR